MRDVDGNEYVDWFNGNCAVTLGHGNPIILESVSRALRRYGALPSLPSKLEAEVAEALVEVVPCAEAVRFLKTGSEACAAAVRIARMATGRDIILTPFGHYHGWHDWTVIRNAQHPGIPDYMVEGIRCFHYGNLTEIENAFALDETREIAAVILEPIAGHTSPVDFLSGLIERAHAHGALVIFDEMITGARWDLGGAQNFLGVTPDLSTHGKAYANGFPLAFVAGRAELMHHAWPISGTFSGEVTGLAACLATLKEYRASGAIEKIWHAGSRLCWEVNKLTEEMHLPLKLLGYPCRPAFNWYAWQPDVETALLQQELAEAGVLVHPSGWNPSAVHGAAELDATIAGCARAFKVLADALSSGDPKRYLRGELLQPAFARAEVKA